MASGKATENDQLVASLNDLFTSVSAMVKGELQETNNVHELLEKMNVRVAEQPTKDARFWKFDRKGIFSVRESYRVDIGLYDPPTNQSVQLINRWWKFLWCLKIPQKMKIFWWRVSNDFIPAEMNLRNHHVPAAGNCKLCMFGKDSTTHSLFFCPTVKPLWKNQTFAHLLNEAPNGSTMDVCEWMEKNLSKPEFERFATFTWFCWKERQRVIHGEGCGRKLRMVEGMDQFLINFQKVRSKKDYNSEGRVPETDLKWKPPPKGKLRLDVDACVNNEKGNYGVGGIIRDNNGNIILAFGKRFEFAGSVLEFELRAIIEGIKIAYSANYHPQFVASDSLLAIQAVIESNDLIGYISRWATKVKQLIESVEDCRLIHVKRTTNQAAHCIAHFASISQLPFVWKCGKFPSWLKELVLKDTHD